MTHRRIAMMSLFVGLVGAAPALAGPGPLPPHLLDQRLQGRGEPHYALTGRPQFEEPVLRPRTEWIGGARDQRTVFVQVDRNHID